MATQLMLNTEPRQAPVALRPYQELAIAHTRVALEKGERRVYFTLPTGTGKTVVLSQLTEGFGRVLVLAHRVELIDQIERRLRQDWDRPVGVVMGRRNEVDADLIAATPQSLHASRLQELAWAGAVDLVIIDEGHHAVPGSRYQGVVDALASAAPELAVVGTTATPFRADRRRMQHFLPTCTFSRTIDDMQREGWLCSLDWRPIKVGMNLAGIKSVATPEGKDFDIHALALEAEDEHVVQAVVDETVDFLGSRPTLVFGVTVAHAKALAAAYEKAGVRAAAIWGDMPADNRARVLAEWRAGRIQLVSNCAVLCLDSETEILTSEGWIGPGEMTYRHKVANWDDGTIFFEEPKFIVRRRRLPAERMVAYESPRLSVRVTEDHRMLVRKRRRGGDWPEHFTIKHAAEILGQALQVPTCGMAQPFAVVPEQPKAVGVTARRVTANAYVLRKQGYAGESAVAEATRRIEDRDALQYKNPSELTLAECSFIGFWIGDGSRAELATGGVEYSCSQSMVYPSIIAWFDDIVARCDLDVARHEYPNRLNGSVRWSFGRGTGFGPQKRAGVFAIEPYLNKDGSELLWGLSAQQFRALILGFWAADGEHNPRSGRSALRISNTNKRLLDLLQAVAVCRGLTARLRPDVPPRKGNHAQLYYLSIADRQAHELGGGRHAFRAEEQWQDEEVWCVTSSTGNIVTRRRGTVTVTGNTEGFDFPEIACVVIARPTRSPSLYVQMLGRGTRMAAGKTDCVVVDVSGNEQLDGSEQVILPDVASVEERDDTPERKPLGGGKRLLVRDPSFDHFYRWVREEDSYVLPAGKSTTLVLLADPRGSGLYHLGTLRSDGVIRRVTSRPDTIWEQQRAAHRWLESNGEIMFAGRARAWHEREVSEKQFDILAEVNPEALRQGLLRGEASAAIAAGYARRYRIGLQKVLWREQLTPAWGPS